jgi:putative component of toxin-antitoxin plasmid stabilization module
MGLVQGRGRPLIQPHLLALVGPSRLRAKIIGRSRDLKLGYFGDVESGGYGVSGCYKS